MDRKEYQKRLKEWVRELKSLSGCKVCGLSDPFQLEFHHRDPGQKIYKISDMVSQGMAIGLILEEIDKCDVLCVEHHEDADKVLLEKYDYKLPAHPDKHPDHRGGRKRRRKKNK